jgi:hypothetical protein
VSWTLAACGGGGDAQVDTDEVGADEVDSDEVIDLTGSWSISERGVSNCPGEENYTEGPYSVTVTQSGNNLRVVTAAGTFTGTVRGRQLSWTGSYPEDGGTVTITAMTLTASADGNSLSGSSNWTWNGDGETCSGNTQAITGTRRGSEIDTVPAARLPLAAGAQWLYSVEQTNRAIASSTGVSTTEFSGRRLLHTEDEVAWQGRSAWRLTQFDLQTAPENAPGLEVVQIYLAQDADGLYKWTGTASEGEWKRILSTHSLAFDAATFLMAGGPSHEETIELRPAVTSVVPAGTYTTLLAYHEFTQTGQYAPEDIFEERWEYYADGVGLVSAAWDYSYDDNDPQGTDLTSVGAVDLLGTNIGPTVSREVEPNDVGHAAQRIEADTIISGLVHIDDAGEIVADVNVAANVNGAQLLQDWYRLDVTTDGFWHIALAYRTYNGINSHYDDLDLYLFREEAPGVLALVDRSVMDPSTHAARQGEWLHRNLPTGVYYLAVQAWKTPSDPVPYWISIR